MSKLHQLVESTFDQDVLASAGPVLVDFYAAHCSPCRMMESVLDDIAREYEGRVTVGRLDVDASDSIAMRYGIMGTPTLGCFRDGRLVDRLLGYPGPRGVRAFVEKHAPAG